MFYGSLKCEIASQDPLIDGVQFSVKLKRSLVSYQSYEFDRWNDDEFVEQQTLNV